MGERGLAHLPADKQNLGAVTLGVAQACQLLCAARILLRILGRTSVHARAHMDRCRYSGAPQSSVHVALMVITACTLLESVVCDGICASILVHPLFSCSSF